MNRTSAGPDSNPISVRLSAAERLELNVTSAFIELAITTATVWSREADRIKEGRGSDAPFKVRNRTGMQIAVWGEQRDLTRSIKHKKYLDDGAEVPWRFEDRKETRDVSAVLRKSYQWLIVSRTSRLCDTTRSDSRSRIRSGKP
jgi:vacuolar protein sorting-associated protein 13A/C